MYRVVGVLAGLAGLAGLAACAPATDSVGQSEDPLIENARSISANEDGTYRVVCKDGSVQEHVTAGDILANRICNPPAPPPARPAPSTSWSAARHIYEGSIHAMTIDERFIFADFRSGEFGRFDLTTYTLTASYGDGNDYRDPTRSQIRTTGSRIVLVKPASFSGTTARGCQVDLRDLADPSFAHTLMRPPIVGAGHLVCDSVRLCSGDRVQWREGGKFVTVTKTSGGIHVEEDGLPLQCISKMFDSSSVVNDRDDRKFADGKLWTCASGECTPVRPLPAGTSAVVFSRSGDWLVYKANGLVYRDSLSGGSLKALPAADYLWNRRDGKLVSATQVYDVEADVFVSHGHDIDTSYGLRLLSRRMAAYGEQGGAIVLFNDANESIGLSRSFSSFDSAGSPGLRRDVNYVPSNVFSHFEWIL